MKPMIQLSDGTGFDFTAPVAPSIFVIANSLSKLCRYVGHAHAFYSVAQHSVLVSQLVEPKFAMVALLHDASEALTGDCSSPLKAMLPAFREIEDRIQQCIYDRYCPGMDGAAATAVHQADLIMLATEQRDLMTDNDPDGVWDWVKQTITPAHEPVVPVDNRRAYFLFVERYLELGGVL